MSSGNSTRNRPIRPAEVPYLEALGAEVRRLRLAADVGQAELSRLTHMSETAIKQIERGVRRTRRSTLETLAGWLIHFDQWATSEGPSEEQEAEIVARLIQLAGPALAPEKLTLEQRVEMRARELAASWVDEYRSTGTWPENTIIEENDVA